MGGSGKGWRKRKGEQEVGERRGTEGQRALELYKCKTKGIQLKKGGGGDERDR